MPQVNEEDGFPITSDLLVAMVLPRLTITALCTFSGSCCKARAASNQRDLWLGLLVNHHDLLPPHWFQICEQYSLSRSLPIGRVMGLALAKRSVRSMGSPCGEPWGTTHTNLPFVDNNRLMDRYNFPRRSTPRAMPEMGEAVRGTALSQSY